jgi:hypothetical protein
MVIREKADHSHLPYVSDRLHAESSEEATANGGDAGKRNARRNGERIEEEK